MKILVIGNSASLGKGLPEGERFSDILKALLEERFCDQAIEVHVRGWTNSSQERSDILNAEIRDRRPDYLLLEPSPLWVTLPLVEPSMRRKLPSRLGPWLDRYASASNNLESRLLQSRFPWLFHLYQKPLNIIGRMLFGSAPLYEPDEAIAAVEELVNLAKRQESMSILVLAGTAPSGEDLRDHAAWSVVRRIIPPGSRDSLQDLADGFIALCDRHKVTFVDTWKVLHKILVPETFLADGIHLKADATRLRAAEVRNAIEHLELVYTKQPLLSPSRS